MHHTTILSQFELDLDIWNMAKVCLPTWMFKK